MKNNCLLMVLEMVGPTDYYRYMRNLPTLLCSIMFLSSICCSVRRELWPVFYRRRK